MCAPLPSSSAGDQGHASIQSTHSWLSYQPVNCLDVFSSAARTTKSIAAGFISKPVSKGSLSDRVEPDEFSVRWSVIAARDAGAVGRDCLARSRRIGRSGAPGLIAVVSRPLARSRRLSGASAAPLDDGSAAGELAVAVVGRAIPLRRGREVELSRRPSRRESAIRTGSGCHPCLQCAGDVVRSAR
ncbi:MAG: hypothetical protein QOH34_719 [Mycobacterium sp.]|jgi:hypothetical protein|nr:hypothetical protein [Mycobacterium sp.]